VKPTALPPTGPDSVGGLLAGSMLLLGLGGALLLVRRRVTGVHDLS
jgi:LPXTG-motif cell wall-anchored protein